PFGILGTVWSILKLRELGVRRPAKLDLPGNLTFAAGLISVLVGITYGIQPYGSHVMGWTSPMVLSLIGGGLVVLPIFCVVAVLRSAFGSCASSRRGPLTRCSGSPCSRSARSPRATSPPCSPAWAAAA